MNASSNEDFDLKTDVGKKLKLTISSMGMTPAQLAEDSGIGLPTIYSILNGRQLPSLDKLRRICLSLHLSLDWLLENDPDSFFVFPEPGNESHRYAEFESVFLRDGGGERISVSRNLSIVHQPIELRRQVLERIYDLNPEQVDQSVHAFKERRRIIDQLEKRRLEYIVISEIEDFVLGRAPWDRVSPGLIAQFIEETIERLENDPIGYQVTLIPRQAFLVNYEILNREVLVLDLGTVFLRQSHDNLLKHFLQEVENFHRLSDTIDGRSQVVAFLRSLLELQKEHSMKWGK